MRTFTTTHTFAATLTPGPSLLAMLLWLIDWLAPVSSEELREERPVSKQPQVRFNALFAEIDLNLSIGYLTN